MPTTTTATPRSTGGGQQRPSLMRESVSRNDRYSAATDTSSSYTALRMPPRTTRASGELTRTPKRPERPERPRRSAGRSSRRASSDRAPVSVQSMTSKTASELAVWRLRLGLRSRRWARSGGVALLDAPEAVGGDLAGADTRRAVPSGSITSTPVLSTPTTLTPSCTSTPIRVSWLRATVDSFSPNAPHTAGAASNRMTSPSWCRSGGSPDATPGAPTADLPGHLHPGRPGPGHHEGQPLLGLGRVGAQLGQRTGRAHRSAVRTRSRSGAALTTRA